MIRYRACNLNHILYRMVYGFTMVLMIKQRIHLWHRFTLYGQLFLCKGSYLSKFLKLFEKNNDKLSSDGCLCSHVYMLVRKSSFSLPRKTWVRVVSFHMTVRVTSLSFHSFKRMQTKFVWQPSNAKLTCMKKLVVCMNTQ